MTFDANKFKCTDLKKRNCWFNVLDKKDVGDNKLTIKVVNFY